LHVIWAHIARTFDGSMRLCRPHQVERSARRSTHREHIALAGGKHNVQNVFAHFVVHENISDRHLDIEQSFEIDDGFYKLERMRNLLLGKNRKLIALIGIAEGNASKEAIELGFRKGINTSHLDCVLGGNYEEWLG